MGSTGEQPDLAGTESVLTSEECWQFLREQEFGRLAFHLGEEVHITPLNYAVDGESLLFRTAPGSKLLGIVMNADVAFEIDEFSEAEVRSVIVRGSARLLEEDEAHRADSVPLRSWVGLAKYNVVELVPSEISGRRFGLNRPWFHQQPGRAEA
ncbi:pyridoxamine 5'-phosphate oxidase family protein [Nocardioides dubius]|uniref:Pyridoxamine 5'-phosphate oxidase family protein n=1 Tax=Nocardioides dubius TaxID=317019 RepID=A0ABP4EE70_9ACTN